MLEKIGWMRKTSEDIPKSSETLTKPDDPEEADKTELSGDQRSHGALAEHVDNDSGKRR